MSTVVDELVKVNVSLESRLPGLLFGGKGVMEADADGSGKKAKRRPIEEEAKLRAHWMGEGKDRQLCIPSVMLYKSFCQAATDFTWEKNKKKSMVYIVGATLAFEQENIPLICEGYSVFAEWVRIPPRTGAMVKIGRPLIREWKADFSLLIDDELWDVNQFEQIINHAGKTVGVGAWRPGLKGAYGRFRVTDFEVVE